MPLRYNVKPERQAGLVLLVAVLLGSAGLALYRRSPSAVDRPSAVSHYVKPEQCRSCHAEIYASYQRVGMAQSFHSGSQSQSPANYFHKNSGRHYQVTYRDGRLFQRRYELDAGGREVNSYELEATHSIGSGNHARTYLHRLSDREIIQLPLTWYTQEQSWGMSPGFDNAAPADFTRLVDDSCLFCHNGYPDHGQLARGIDCQRCHGPGSDHVRLAGLGKADVTAIQAAIVNPKKLTNGLQIDICMQCHLETTSAELPQSLRKFDRLPFSYRPGEPLGSYRVHFDHPEGSGHDGKFEIVNQAYRLRQSACFRKSSGRMTCSSCHDPHDVPRGAKATAYYRSRCVACHDKVAARDHPNLQTAECATCHMPKRRAEDAVHVVMTDHLIQRKRPAHDLTRPLREQASRYSGPLAIYLSGELSSSERNQYLGVALISGGADRKQGIRLLEGEPSAHAKALAVLGEGYFAEGNAQAAIVAFERALSAQPGLPKARYNLGLALGSVGRV